MAALEHAIAEKEDIVLIAQTDHTVKEPSGEDLFQYGTVASIKQVVSATDGEMRVVVKGKRRVKVDSIESGNNFDIVHGQIVPEIEEESDEMIALARTAINLVGQYASYINRDQDLRGVLSETLPAAQIADLIAAHLVIPIERRQQLLEEANVKDRLEQTCRILSDEIQLLKLERKIESRVRKEMEQAQKEYYLRERMKVIRTELGEEDDRQGEVDEFKEKIKTANLPEEAREKAEREVSRLAKMPPLSQEAVVVRTYIEWILSLPWNEKKGDDTTFEQAESILHEDHFGLDKIKERIVEFIAVRKLKSNPKSPVLCLVGPPGVGKTSLARSIARALGRQFFRFSLGGVRDESEIRGHRRTYIGAMPGRIIQGMRRAGSNNPLILLDEIDKMTADFRGDPASALLEALDPEQNNTFSDHYLEIPFDLSDCIFVTTANTTRTIPPALLDRMELIQLEGYTEEEKVEIARRHLLPQSLLDHGLSERHVSLSDNALRMIVRQFTREAGVRELMRQVTAICRKAARHIASGGTKINVTVRNVERYLGTAPYLQNQTDKIDQVGVAHGLAYTRVGGDTIVVETTVMQGKGDLTLTGKLGDVMRESAQAAFSYIRSRADVLGLDPRFYETKDIHIHVPEGAVPKEGPSAGVTMTVALISALTGRPVRRDVGMTGEITLRGRVLPVGGIKEKVLAAHRAGLRKVLIPARNERDLHDLSPNIKAALDIHLIDTLDEAVQIALLPPPSPPLQSKAVPTELVLPLGEGLTGGWAEQDVG